jgi:archaemetzincin
MEGILVCWMGVGPADPGLLERVRAHVETVFGPPVEVVEERALPEGAFDARRGQWESGAILRWLSQRHPQGRSKLLGVTDVDLFLPILTFVFGEAQLDGRAAVVSTHRLGASVLARRVDGLLMDRLRKEAIHELGHAWGLVHCGNPRCAMTRSPGVSEIDSKGEGLCADCQLLYREARRRER